MSQTIIELSQQDNTATVHQDGDYTTSLKRPVIIEKGDELILKSCFVDNRISNSKSIVVKGDVLPNGDISDSMTVNVGIGYYKTDILGTWEKIATKQTTEYTEGRIIRKTRVDNSNDPRLGVFTGRPFVACEPLKDPDTTLVDVNSFTLFVDFKIPDVPYGGKVPTFTLTLFYPIAAGQPLKSFNVTFRTAFHEQGLKNGFFRQDTRTGRLVLTLNDTVLSQLVKNRDISSTIGFPFYVQKPPAGSTLNDTIVDLAKNNGNFQSVQSSPHTEGVNGTFTNYENEVSFTIPVGVYDPNVITQLINEKMVSIQVDPSQTGNDFEITENPLLKTMQQIRLRENKQLVFYDPTDNDRKFVINTSADAQGDPELLNYYIGTSQFGLSFNESSGKMEIIAMHNSLFSGLFKEETNSVVPTNTVFAPEVRIIRNEALVSGVDGCGQPDQDASQAAATKFVANKNCGIYLTKLEPQEFWYGANSSMGFDENIFPSFAQFNKVFKTEDLTATGQPKPIITSNEKVYMPNNLTEGINITSDECGLDELIVKRLSAVRTNGAYVQTSFNSFDIQTAMIPSNQIFSDIVGVNSIQATNPVGSSILEASPYYKISVDLGIKSDVRGNGNGNTISSIVSKYYSQNSYTSAYSEGSIGYVHQSDEPVVLNDIRVRILNNNNELSKGIGDNSSVFLQVSKAPQNSVF
jgi:hypothetical protein